MTPDPIHTASLRLSAQARHLSHGETVLLTTLDHQRTPVTPAQRARLAEACTRVLGDTQLAAAVSREGSRAA